jgi:hypothetical protein
MSILMSAIHSFSRERSNANSTSYCGKSQQAVRHHERPVVFECGAATACDGVVLEATAAMMRLRQSTVCRCSGDSWMYTTHSMGCPFSYLPSHATLHIVGACPGNITAHTKNNTYQPSRHKRL